MALRCHQGLQCLGQPVGRTGAAGGGVDCRAFHFCSEHCGNVCAACRASLELFKVDEVGFRASQLDQLGHLSPEQLQSWKAANSLIHQEVEVRCGGCWFGALHQAVHGSRSQHAGMRPCTWPLRQAPSAPRPTRTAPAPRHFALQVGGNESTVMVSSLEPAPGFLEMGSLVRIMLKATLRPVCVLIDGAQRDVTLVQVGSGVELACGPVLAPGSLTELSAVPPVLPVPAGHAAKLHGHRGEPLADGGDVQQPPHVPVPLR